MFYFYFNEQNPFYIAKMEYFTAQIVSLSSSAKIPFV